MAKSRSSRRHKSGGNGTSSAAGRANDAEALLRQDHRKVEQPPIYYTVGELRDCTGACHRYSDATLTNITEMRSGEHRVRSREW